MCTRPAASSCERCRRRVCKGHASARDGWPCLACEKDYQDQLRGTLAGRVAAVSGAAIAGMIGGALVMMLIAGALGLRAELVILLMLLAEMGVGGFCAWAADRRLDRWIEMRARAELEPHLPEARLLRGSHTSAPEPPGKGR